MKFTVQTDSLKEALKKLGFAVKSKSILPAISNILVTVADNEVMLTTTDLMVTINYALDCVPLDAVPESGKDNVNEGQFLVPFELLKNIVALETGNVTITWDEKKGAIAQFEQDTFSLGNGGSVGDFPKVVKVGRINHSVPAEFVTALRMASLSVSTDDMRPVMQNICIELNKESVVVTSTDSHSLYTQTLATTLELDEKAELLVPIIVAKVLEGFEETKIGFNKNLVSFESGPVMVTTKRAEGNFPNWRSIMPKHEGNLCVDLVELKQAVEKAYVVSDSTYNGIDLLLAESILELKTEVEDTGVGCSVKVPATSTGHVNHVRYSGRLLKRIIAQLEKHTKDNTGIVWCITEANRAATIKVDGNDNVTCLLTPIRIS